MSEQIGPICARDAYAGFIRRTLALGIDAVFLVGLWILAPWAWYVLAPVSRVTAESYLWVYYVLLLVGLGYLLGFRVTENGTPGYRIMRIRYAYMLSGKASASTLAFRAVLALFLLLFFALDHLWILFDSRKQAWHDKVTGFYVVKCGAQPVATRRIVRRLIGFMMLTFVVWEPATDDDQPASGR